MPATFVGRGRSICNIGALVFLPVGPDPAKDLRGFIDRGVASWWTVESDLQSLQCLDVLGIATMEWVIYCIRLAKSAALCS